jgi:2-amino-4-hydroxy-6-hydroxymethyldihydropteridine diphosphokinase
MVPRRSPPRLGSAARERTGCAERGGAARTHLAFVALGSNLGDREAHLRRALQALRATRGILRVGVSRIYETDPVGPLPQGPYLNAVAEIETGLEPRALLERLLEIEAEEGRIRRGVRGEARTLDLDLLLFADLCIDEEALTLPHPRMHERGFVLEPLCDLAPQRVHPRSGETIAELAARLRDPVAVRLWRGADTDQDSVSPSSNAGKRTEAVQRPGPVDLA